MKTQSAFINPVTLPPRESWTPAEERFVQCMAQGEPCIISESIPMKKDGENAKVVRAEVIKFFAWGGDNTNSIRGNSISLMGAWVPNQLDLTNVPISYSVAFLNCHFNADVLMQYAECRSLSMDNSYLSADFFGDGMRIFNTMSMCGVAAPKGEVRLLTAKIGGELNCSNSAFNNEDGPALSADKIQVDGNVTMENVSAKGGVRFPSANINGSMSFDGSTLENVGGIAFFADRIRIAGNLHLRNHFRAIGKVQLSTADIGLTFSCSNGTFINKDGCAILVDDAKIGSIASFRDNFLAEGEVRLLRAHVCGDMYCTAGAFINEHGKALNADGIRIDGSLHLHKGFVANGKVQLVYANIGGLLLCDDGYFNNGIALEGTRIGKSLFWRNVNGRGHVNLAFATAGIFDYGQISQKKFRFTLDGFSYERFIVTQDASSRINWLNNRARERPFSPQPFQQAAKVLFAMGYDNDARKILLQKERWLTKQGKLSNWRKIKRKIWDTATVLVREGRLVEQGELWHKIGRRLWDVFAGYGYLLRKTLAWSAGVIMAGWLVFFTANTLCHIVPHQPAVVALMNHPDFQAKKECEDIKRPTDAVACMVQEYPRFNSFFYSLDVFIPFFALHQEQYWYPQPKDDNYIARFLLAVWYWMEIIFGWLLTSLLVLSITGLLRPRHSSSGE